MEEDDSRTATVGRKRQRELQDEQPDVDMSTPDKKMKLDGDDSDYSPSLDPQDKPSRERPESPSQLDLDYPHMSAQSEAAAKADQLSSAQEKAESSAQPESAQPAAPVPEAEDFIALPADDEFGAENDDASSINSNDDEKNEGGEKEESDEPSAGAGQVSGVQTSIIIESGPITLTKTQTKLIREFEGERALRILKNGIGSYWSSKKGFHGKNVAGVVVTMAVPQMPDKKNPGKTTNAVVKETIRASLATVIGANCPMGLLAMFHDNQPDSKDFNQLIVYRKQEQVDALKNYLAASPIELVRRGSGKKESFLLNVLSTDNSNALHFQDNRKLKTNRGITASLAEGLTTYVKRLLQSGNMAPDAYEGFNPDAPKRVLHKAIKQDIGVGVLKADPKYAWDHLGDVMKPSLPPPKEVSEPQSQAVSKEASAPSTKPSTPASEARGQQASSGEEGEISDEEAEYTPPSPPLQNDNQPSNGPAPIHMSQLAEAERQLQARYFGSARDDDPVRCLTCAQPGHMQEDCPSRTCQHCKAVDQHFSHSCPMVAKCTKCRERGHSKDTCPAKLARTAADGFFCDLCNQSGHVEEECSYLWRTFDPDKIPNLNKVARMIVSCYQCGSHMHWGDDCPMRPRKVTVNCDTFSAKEANKYLIDPEAAAAELRQNGFSGQGMSIKGRAQNQHTYFTSSEDEGDIDNFYRNKRSNNSSGAPRGNIRINAGAGPRGGRFSQKNDRGGGNNNYNEYRHNSNQFEPITRGWQPPLPNEPPPPLPPQPARGGYGGRGRGRGRGGGGGGGGGGGSGVNQMPLPARPVAPPRKPRRGGKR